MELTVGDISAKGRGGGGKGPLRKILSDPLLVKI